MQKLFTAGVAFAIAASLACGTSEMEKQAEEAARQAEKAAEAATKAAEAGAEAGAKAGEAASENMAKGMEDFAKAMSGMAGVLAGDGKTVEPVTFQALQGTLPEMPGWEMTKPRGQRMTAPVPLSQSETSYTRGDARIDVSVARSHFNELAAEGRLKDWVDAYEVGHVRVSGDAAVTKLIGNVIQRQVART